MIVEIFAIVFLIGCANVIAHLIGRRRDVLYYVSRSRPG
jgi:hypothetical protein